jgi:hypothetical protein
MTDCSRPVLARTRLARALVGRRRYATGLSEPVIEGGSFVQITTGVLALLTTVSILGLQCSSFSVFFGACNQCVGVCATK